MNSRSTQTAAAACVQLARGFLVVVGCLTTDSALYGAPGDLLATMPKPASAGGFYATRVAAADGRILTSAFLSTVDGVSSAGIAYAFDGKNGELAFELPNPAPIQNDFFGRGLAAGEGRIVVGTGGLGLDRVHVFDSVSGQHQFTIRRPAIPPGATSGAFGKAVAIDEGMILVGDEILRIDGNNTGGAYLFDASDGKFVMPVLDPEPNRGDVFGNSVAFLDGNLVVAARSDWTPTGGPNGGSVFLFAKTTGEPILTIENPDPLPGNESTRFGSAIATYDDRILVGAEQAWMDGVQDVGKAYVFDGTTGDLLFDLPHPSPGEHEQFGISVAALDGHILVGALDDPDGIPGAGSVFLFDGRSGELLMRFNHPDPRPGDLFGRSLAVLDGNIVVGASGREEVYLIEGLGNLVVGDTDADGDVDIDDLNAVRNHFGQAGPDDGTLPGDTWPYDGAINIDDLNRIRNYFGTTRHPTVPVPEPSTLALAALIATVALIFGQRTWVMGSYKCGSSGILVGGWWSVRG